MSDATAVLSAEITANPQKLIEGFQRANAATGAWADAAARSMQTAQASFNGVDFTVVTSKAKAEQIKLIELQHQLDVARAAGEKQTVTALSEEIALLQKVRQLRSAGFSHADATTGATAQIAAIAAAREASEAREAAKQRSERIRGNPTEALQNVFSNTRLGVIEEGSTKIPIFGAALEALGPAGLTAAAGVAAVAVAIEQATRAAEYSEDIEKTAAKLGITTSALQEYDFTALKAGVSTQTFREAIRSGNEAFGAFLSNVGDAKIKQAFAAIGITKENARSLGDLQTALPVIADKIKALGNSAEQAQIAKKLGLEELLPVLRQGGAALDDTAKEARALGLVIDHEMIEKGAKAAEQLKIAGDVVEKNLARAFVSLAPIVAAVTDKVAKLAEYIGDVAESFQKLENQSSGYLQREAKREQGGIGVDENVAQFFGARKNGDGRYAGGVLPGLNTSINGRLDRVHDMNVRGVNLGLDDKVEAAGLKAPATALVPEKGKTVDDQTSDLDKAAVDAAESGLKELSAAQAALTKNIEAHAAAERNAVDADTQKKLADLSAEEVKVRQSKNDAHKASQVSLLEQAKTDVIATASAKKELIDRQAAEAQSAADLQFQQQQEAYQDAILTAQASLATSAQQRADLGLQVYRDEQVRALDSRKQSNDAKVADGSLTRGDADTDIAGLRGQQNADTIAERTRQQRQINPLYDRANPTTSVSGDLQGVEAKGLDSLTDTLTAITTRSEDAKTAFHGLINGMIADLARLALQREIEAPLANLLFGASLTNNLGNLGQVGGVVSVGSDILGLPGHASGSDGFSGLTRINEMGPEGVAFLPSNTQIIPNDTLRGLAALTPDRLGRGDMSVTHSIKIDLTGANGDDTIRQIAYAAAAQGSAHAISQSRSDLRNVQAAGRRDLTRF